MKNRCKLIELIKLRVFVTTKSKINGGLLLTVISHMLRLKHRWHQCQTERLIYKLPNVCTNTTSTLYFILFLKLLFTLFQTLRV